MLAVSHPRRWLALALGLGAALILEDVAISWLAGAPAKAWGVLRLSTMRLGMFSAVGLLLSAAAWLCAAGVPRSFPGRLTLFGALIAAVLLGNGRYIGSNDVTATRLLPFVIAREGRLCVEDSAQLTLETELPYWFVRTGSHVVSRYPVATAFLALPAYLPALVGSYDAQRERVHELERIAAALLALASVLAVVAIGRRWLDERAAWAAALIYAFGTQCSTVLSKALWQHTGGAFGFTLALCGLYLLRRSWQQQACIGLGIGIAIAARSTNVAPAAFVGLAAVSALGLRGALGAGLWALLPVAAQLGYADFYFGSIRGNGYGREAVEGWTGTGWLGLLVSPGRGLFVYAPCLVFAAVAMLRGPGTDAERRQTRLLLAAIASLWLVMGRWWCWWGGGSPGERMLSDVAPLWGVGLALAWKQFAASPRWRLMWFASCGYACAVHALIVFVRPGGFATEQFYRVMSGAWSPLAYAPLTYVLGWTGR